MDVSRSGTKNWKSISYPKCDEIIKAHNSTVKRENSKLTSYKKVRASRPGKQPVLIPPTKTKQSTASEDEGIQLKLPLTCQMSTRTQTNQTPTLNGTKLLMGDHNSYTEEMATDTEGGFHYRQVPTATTRDSGNRWQP